MRRYKKRDTRFVFMIIEKKKCIWSSICYEEEEKWNVEYVAVGGWLGLFSKLGQPSWIRCSRAVNESFSQSMSSLLFWSKLIFRGSVVGRCWLGVGRSCVSWRLVSFGLVVSVVVLPIVLSVAVVAIGPLDLCYPKHFSTLILKSLN